MIEGLKDCLKDPSWQWNIIPPEAHPDLKKPPDPSEISIRRNFRKPHISIRTKIISKNYTKRFVKMIQSLQLLIRNDILLIRGKMIVSQMTEVGHCIDFLNLASEYSGTACYHHFWHDYQRGRRTGLNTDPWRIPRFKFRPQLLRADIGCWKRNLIHCSAFPVKPMHSYFCRNSW